MDEHMAFYNDKAKEDYRFLSEIEELIKALQKEPVSEDLEEAAETYTNSRENEKFEVGEGYDMDDVEKAFKAGAQWQKVKMMKDAVEAILYFDYGDNSGFYGMVELHDIPMKDMEDGDRVKVIIIKED